MRRGKPENCPGELTPMEAVVPEMLKDLVVAYRKVVEKRG